MAGRKGEGEGARFPTSHLSICHREEEEEEKKKEEEARVPGTKTTKNLRNRISRRKRETAEVAAAMMEEEKGAKAEGGAKEGRGAGTASHGRAHIF